MSLTDFQSWSDLIRVYAEVKLLDCVQSHVQDFLVCEMIELTKFSGCWLCIHPQSRGHTFKYAFCN